jgi:hypothetical protein
MPSLTPEHRRDEIAATAMNDGMLNGVLAFAPSLAGLYLAMKNPTFRKVTNGQSRTAIAIMPPLFIFAVTGEQKLTHRMHEVASESEHNLEVCCVMLIIYVFVCLFVWDGVGREKATMLYLFIFLFSQKHFDSKFRLFPSATIGFLGE